MIKQQAGIKATQISFSEAGLRIDDLALSTIEESSLQSLEDKLSSSSRQIVEQDESTDLLFYSAAVIRPCPSVHVFWTALAFLSFASSCFFQMPDHLDREATSQSSVSIMVQVHHSAVEGHGTRTGIAVLKSLPGRRISNGLVRVFERWPTSSPVLHIPG